MLASFFPRGDVSMTESRTRALLVFPRFNANSFWSLEAVCDVWGAKCPGPPLGLITLAALLPQSWDLKLVNRNAEELTDEHLDWADLVLTGGMMPQQADTLELVSVCRARGLPVAVGGPGVTSTPEHYESADFLVIGEAEGMIDRFVAAWESGARQGRFEAERFKADVTKSPVPRFDLLDFRHYLFVGVQFSRGCPFTCEFCDIIELYGRVPRTKTADQMLAELDTLVALGYRGHLDFVDDNLIGNKKAIKLFLPHLIAWQERNGFPFMFSTEASVNLADDDELLRLMREAGFFAVFIGIESPDTATLIATQKKQNTRRSLADSIRRINAAGMFVTAGFIIGFDTEQASVSDAMVRCLEETSIPLGMIGLLTALPNTQLTRRLEREGRLYRTFDDHEADIGDQCTAGLNFATLRPRREVMLDYRDVLSRLYEPAAYFGRVRTLARQLDRPRAVMGKLVWASLRRDLSGLFRAAWRMTFTHPELARHFWPAVIDCLRTNPKALQILIINMVPYLHVGPFSRHVIGVLEERVRELDAGLWVEPERYPSSAPPVAIRAPVNAAA